MAPADGLIQVGEKRRLTFFAAPGAPAIARFDVDALPGPTLPKVFIWNQNLYIGDGSSGEYFETAPHVIDVPTVPAEPLPRAALILQPTEKRPLV